MLTLHNFAHFHILTFKSTNLREYILFYNYFVANFVAFFIIIMPKGSREGIKFRVRNKAKKKPCFKGKRLSDMRKAGEVLKENVTSQSGSIQTNTPDQVANNGDLSTVKSTSERKLENAT
jgi:hypothetical protein